MNDTTDRDEILAAAKKYGWIHQRGGLIGADPDLSLYHWTAGCIHRVHVYFDPEEAFIRVGTVGKDDPLEPIVSTICHTLAAYGKS